MPQNFWVKDKCFNIQLCRPKEYNYGYRIWEAYFVSDGKKCCIATSEVSLKDVRQKVRQWASETNHSVNQKNTP